MDFFSPSISLSLHPYTPFLAAYVAAVIIFNRITLSQQHPTTYNIYHIAAKIKDNYMRRHDHTHFITGPTLVGERWTADFDGVRGEGKPRQNTHI